MAEHATAPIQLGPACRPDQAQYRAWHSPLATPRNTPRASTRGRRTGNKVGLRRPSRPARYASVSTVRVLLSAYACAPGWSSEPGLGWGVASSMAALHDVWVLTDEQSRVAIEDPVNAGFRPRLTVEYVTVPAAIRAAGRYPAYLAWQVAAYRRARRLHAQLKFDLVHHVTFANSFLPSWLGRLGIPFVWYSGSLVTTKPSFLLGLGARSCLSEVVRNFAVRVLGRVSRRLTLTPTTFVVTLDPKPPCPRRPWKQFVGVGLEPWERDLLLPPSAAQPVQSQPFRVLSVGNLLGLKGFHLGIRAFAEFKEHVPDAEYWIIGDGQQRRRLERLRRSLHLDDSVKLLGSRSRADTLSNMATCDVLLHPCLHEHLGFVVLEAMAASRPVICLDAAGPPELVGSSGVIVPVTDPRGVVKGLANALAQLHDDPELRRHLGSSALNRLTTVWNWPRIAREIDEIYGEALTAIGSRGHG